MPKMKNNLKKKIMQINEQNKRKGKYVYHKVGIGETEKRAASIQHRVSFIKKICDYAYPDILIWQIKNKSDMHNREIKENKLKILIRKKELEQKLREKRFNNYLFQDSIIIKKIL